MTNPKEKSVLSESGKETSSRSSPLFLIHGDDDYLVNEEARKIIASLTPKGATEFNLETIEGLVSNQAEAEAVFRRLFESLQSHSFFASEKVVWWRNTNLLGGGSTATASSVTESLTALNDLLKAGLQPGFSLVITATEMDGRKAIIRTFQQQGKVVAFNLLGRSGFSTVSSVMATYPQPFT